VTEINDKFIDLNMADDTGYGQDEMQSKQEKFEREIKSVKTQFKARMLEFPQSVINHEITEVSTELIENMLNQD
jgi:hypothetical protein